MVETSRRDWFVSVLTTALDKGSVQGALRHAHGPCRQLVTFHDFVNETIVRALKKCESFGGNSEGELVAWIKVIGQRLMIDLLRRSKARRAKPLPIQVNDPSVVSPDEALTRIEDLAWLNRVMASLSDQETQILRERYYNDAKWSDISENMNVSPNYLAVLHMRLLKKLRKLRSGQNRR